MIAELGKLLSGEEEIQADHKKLDGEIEKIELKLRELVVEKDAAIKSHVMGNIKQRIKIAARNDASLKDFNDIDLLTKLSHTDIRELEGLFSGDNWTKFENIFESKGTLKSRFNQLVNLRNSIRHSRNVDIPTLKDGQAAIHWFKDFLGML